MPHSSCPQGVPAWRAHLTFLGRSTKTVETRTGSVWAISNAIGTAPENLTAEKLHHHFSTTTYKTWTRRTYITSLRQYLVWSGRPEIAESLVQARRPRRVPNPIPEEQLTLLLAYVTGWVRLTVLLGAYAGLRAHEVAKCRWEDVLLFGERTLLRVHGKGDVVDLVPLPPILATVLREERPVGGRGYLFPSDHNPTGHISAPWVSKKVSRAAAEIGISMHFQMLRHRYGTAVHRARGNLLLTQQRMRHADPASTAGYALISDDEGHAVVDELPGALVPIAPPEPAPSIPLQPSRLDVTA